MLRSAFSLVTIPFSSTLLLLKSFSKIYTKTGDQGDTQLVSGLRKSKDHPIFHLLGDIDELNSYLGLCNSILSNDRLKVSINQIQNHLYHISAYLASKDPSNIIEKTMDKKLENEIDSMTEQLIPLRNLIQPGGSIEASHLHYARTLTRRVERRYVRYSKYTTPNKDLLIFFNRLSDYLFVSARYANHLKGIDDVISV